MSEKGTTIDKEWFKYIEDNNIESWGMDEFYRWMDQRFKKAAIDENKNYYNALTEMYYSKDGNSNDKIILQIRKLFKERIEELEGVS